MNFWSLSIFEKLHMEPGSYLYRNRFLKVLQKHAPGFWMGTRFLPIQEPVPACKKSQFANFNTGNSVPPHREPVPTTCNSNFCYFWQLYAPSIISKLSNTNCDIRNTNLWPFYTIITSNNIVYSSLFVIWHTNDPNSIHRHKIGFHSINL